MLSLKIPQDGSTPFKILCLGSHSDDIEIGCGGTILRLLAEVQEIDVTWIVLASNADREREARNSAAQFLGRAAKKNVIVKSFRDGFFPFDGAQIKNYFEQEIKPISADLVFTHNRKDAHQDHRLVAELTWNTFRNHLILEYEIPKYDGDMGQPNFFVPLDRDICENKTRYLLEAFQTQRSKAWFSRETFLGLMRLRGVECVSPSGYAEAFYCRKVIV